VKLVAAADIGDSIDQERSASAKFCQCFAVKAEGHIPAT
jgi:hypothetical protein